MSESMPFYGLVRAYAWSLVAGHYRRHHVGSQIPPDGPLVLVCNHNNGLVDGALQFDITDRKLRVLAKYKLFETFGLAPMVRALGAIPVYRQKDGVDTSKNISAFQAIGEALRSGGSILLFPEGESTFHHRVRPFHTGVARMALGAEDPTDFTTGIQIVSVGLAYDEPYAYRSNAWMWIGEPVTCTDLRELYQSDGRKCVRVFLAQLQAAQCAVTVELDEATDHRPVCFGETLLPQHDLHVPARRRNLAAAIGRLRAQDPSEASKLTSRLSTLGKTMAKKAIDPKDLEQPAKRPLELLRAVGGVLILLALVPVGLMVAPPYLLARTIAHKSSAPRDKVVTISVLLASVSMPLWALIWSLVCGLRYGAAWGAGCLGLLLLAFGLMPRLWERRRTLRHALTRLGPDSALEPLRSEAAELRQAMAALPAEDPPSTEEP